MADGCKPPPPLPQELGTAIRTGAARTATRTSFRREQAPRTWYGSAFLGGRGRKTISSCATTSSLRLPHVVVIGAQSWTKTDPLQPRCGPMPSQKRPRATHLHPLAFFAARRRPRLAQRLRHSPLAALIVWPLGPSVSAPLYSRCVATGSDGEAPKGSPAAPRPEVH